MNENLTIQQVAELTGMSEHNLRYYEKIGLILPVCREASSRHRRYTEAQVNWIRLLACLRATGMSLAQMKRLADLQGNGPEVWAERRHVLEAHQQFVRDDIRQLETIVAFLDLKLAHIQEREAHDGQETEASRRLVEQMDKHLKASLKPRPSV